MEESFVARVALDLPADCFGVSETRVDSKGGHRQYKHPSKRGRV